MVPDEQQNAPIDAKLVEAEVAMTDPLLEVVAREPDAFGATVVVLSRTLLSITTVRSPSPLRKRGSQQVTKMFTPLS